MMKERVRFVGKFGAEMESCSSSCLLSLCHARLVNQPHRAESIILLGGDEKGHPYILRGGARVVGECFDVRGPLQASVKSKRETPWRESSIFRFGLLPQSAWFGQAWKATSPIPGSPFPICALKGAFRALCFPSLSFCFICLLDFLLSVHHT